MERLARKPKRKYNQHEFRDSDCPVPRSTAYYSLRNPAKRRPSGVVAKPKPKAGQFKERRRDDIRLERHEGAAECSIIEAGGELPREERRAEKGLDRLGDTPADDSRCDSSDVQVLSGESLLVGHCHSFNENAVVIDEEDELFSEIEEYSDGEDISECEVCEDDMSSSESSSEDEVAPTIFLSTKDRIRLLLLLATKQRHNLSYGASDSIMKLAGLCGDNMNFFPSKHLMKDVIDKFSSSLVEHHICPNCTKYIGPIVSESIIAPCCGHQVNACVNKKSGNIFLYLSIEEQLRVILECGLGTELIEPSSREKINSINYEDIFDGAIYKLLVKEGLSFNFFIDGLQVASTSKFSAWPVLLCLNELPLHLRRKYVMMASIWLGKTKPDMNEYLKPFVAECKHLQENGLKFKRDGNLHSMKVTPLMCVSDSIARPLIRNSTQFNGEYGCGLCHHPGYELQVGKGRARSYSVADGEFPSRTHEETLQFATQAENSGRRVKGIKGHSILSDISGFDIINCVDLDLFHALVNVSKRFTNLWLHKKYRKEPFSVRKKFKCIDARLLAITPTDSVSRAPRSLKERSDWRGHEWFYWIVIYSLPVLKGILTSKYLTHWSLLVQGIALIMQNSVAKSELVYAGRYLHKFYVEIDELYGLEHCTFSGHLLTHLVTSVQNFGQPWTHSAFLFESILGELKCAVKSSNGVGQQISKSVQLKIALKKMKEDLSNYMSNAELQYLEHVTTSRKLADPDLILGAVSLLGPQKILCLDVVSFHAISKAGYVCVQGSEYKCYDRCIFNSELYQTVNYSRSQKQNNSIVLLECGKTFELHKFVVIGDDALALGFHLVENLREGNWYRLLQHIEVFEAAPDVTLQCIPISDFQMKLISFSVKQDSGSSLRFGCVNVLQNEMLS